MSLPERGNSKYKSRDETSVLRNWEEPLDVGRPWKADVAEKLQNRTDRAGLVDCGACLSFTEKRRVWGC